MTLRLASDGMFHLSGSVGEPLLFADGYLQIPSGDQVALNADGLLQVVPDTGLLGHWPLSGMELGVFPDKTSNENDAIPDDDIAWVYQDGGIADATPGENSICFPHTIALLPASWEFHLEFFSTEAENQFGLKLPQPGGAWSWITVDDLSPGIWHKIEVEYNAPDAEVLIWVDGVLTSLTPLVIDWADYTNLTLHTNPRDTATSPYIRNVKLHTYDPN